MPIEAPTMVCGALTCRSFMNFCITRRTLNPTTSQLEESDISVLVSGTKESVVMVEGGAESVSEEDFLNAIYIS